jgi:hypothetical protein
MRDKQTQTDTQDRDRARDQDRDRDRDRDRENRPGRSDIYKCVPCVECVLYVSSIYQGEATLPGHRVAILTLDPLHSSRKLPAIPCTAHFVAPYTEHLAYVRSPATDEMNTTYNPAVSEHHLQPRCQHHLQPRCQQHVAGLFQ